MKVTGSCHCGEVTFTADADPDKTMICHCTDCQKLTGSAFRITVRVPEDKFTLLSGTPKAYLKTTAESGNPRIHAFCPQCGTPIYATSTEGPKTYGLRVGTLDQRAHFIPTREYWCQSAQAWVDIPGTKRVEKQ